MDQRINPYVSIDCVLLGFDGEQLNVLVVRQSCRNGEESTGNYKLPGSLINMDENLDDAAQRVLRQLTGLNKVGMKQFHAFGGAQRVANPNDVSWLERFHNLDHHIERIVTIAYLSLIRIDRKMQALEEGFEAQWMPIGQLPNLAFDHSEIVNEAVDEVRRMVSLDHKMLFKLLPHKFTAAQLRVAMETISGKMLDVKNFHKKLASMPCVVALDEKEEGVGHRAARYYRYHKMAKAKS